MRPKSRRSSHGLCRIFHDSMTRARAEPALRMRPNRPLRRTRAQTASSSLLIPMRWRHSRRLLPGSISVVRKCWWKPSSSRLMSPRAESWGSSGCSPTTLGFTVATLVRRGRAAIQPLPKPSCPRMPLQQKLVFEISQVRCHRFQARPSDGVWSIKISR